MSLKKKKRKKNIGHCNTCVFYCIFIVFFLHHSHLEFCCDCETGGFDNPRSVSLCNQIPLLCLLSYLRLRRQNLAGVPPLRLQTSKIREIECELE